MAGAIRCGVLRGQQLRVSRRRGECLLSPFGEGGGETRRTFCALDTHGAGEPSWPPTSATVVESRRRVSAGREPVRSGVLPTRHRIHILEERNGGSEARLASCLRVS